MNSTREGGVMNKYLKIHEKYIKDELNEENADFIELLNYHKIQIEFLQHERIIHLIVTLFFAFLLVIFAGLYLLLNIMLLDYICMILFVVLIFYIVHYYQLENGVQRWYLIYNEIRNRIKRGTHV